MPTTLKTAVSNYLRFGSPARGTRAEYHTTLRKWKQWGGGVPIEKMGRKEIREFLDWVYERAVGEGRTNPGRTANKAREHLRAVISWAWDQELIETLPRFPKPRQQRDVAGRHYLTKAEINALLFATHKMLRPRGWDHPIPVGRYWCCALVLFFNYGLDTGTVWKSTSDGLEVDVGPRADPLAARIVEPATTRRPSQVRVPLGVAVLSSCEDRQGVLSAENRVIHAHLKSIAPEDPQSDHPVFLGGGSRPNARFRELCNLAGIKPKKNVETGQDEPWVLKDLRKTCATYYDEHVPESSIEILGYFVSGITYRHYAHRAPLAFKAIMTLPQPSAFTALVRGFDGECPCCRRRFPDAPSARAM